LSRAPSNPKYEFVPDDLRGKFHVLMSPVQSHPVAEPEPPAAEAASGLQSVERSEIPTRRDTPHFLRSALPELLAPAGDWACAKAAVENGADAIYFGLEQFNARMRADNFTQADLPNLIEFLHRRGVKGYVTFNTLVFENEMAQAEGCLRAMIAAGVDAAVVQDAGICRLIRRLSPDFPIHVSTQMTITSAAGVEFARELGCNLVVLARECSLKEIEKLAAPDAPQAGLAGPKAAAGAPRAEGPPPGPASLPIEVFIHGALCVAYSGQCLTSEALGGRSANRGECAQACRMPYELIADGKQVPLGDRKYLLSPQDLAGLSVLPDLVRIGVASLKIEGRLKSPEYVANITRIYRSALDGLRNAECGAGGVRSADCGVRNDSPGAAFPIPHSALRIPHYEMEMAFSRGLYTGWFHGVNNQELVHGRFGKKRGVYLGKVLAVRHDGVRIDLEGPLKPGDGVVFDAGQPEEKEEGGRVYQIKAGPVSGPRGPSGKPPSDRKSEHPGGGNPVLLCFGRGDIDLSRVRAGDKLWKTSDPELERRLRQSFEGNAPKFQRPLEVEAHGLTGAPLTLVARDELGHIARVDSAMPLAPADKQPLTTERLRQQLGRLGGTPFRLGDLKNCLEGNLLLPLSELNRLRRQLVRELETQRGQPKRWTIECGVRSAQRGMEEARSTERRVPNDSPGAAVSIPHSALRTPHLIVLARNLAQVEAALQCGIETLYCEFEDPKKYREAVAHFRRSAFRTAHSALFVAPPRIFKMGEEWILEQVRSCGADGWLVRNYDHLGFFAQGRRVGDYSLNIANRLAADYFKNQFGLERVTASYDLNFTQLEALLQAAPPDWFEVTLHQHIPMFHMEHCLFCAFLSNGTDYRNCGRPCDQHDVRLRDRVGAQHPVKADAGCRNTVFNARAQTGADYAAHMLALGVRHFRLEFLDESPAQASQTIGMYRQLLRGEITGPQLWRELKLLNQLGVTRGQIAG
jgi:putative protease